MTVNFYLHRDPKSKRPDLQIYCYVRLVGSVLHLKTEQRIRPEQWNNKLQIAKTSFVGSPELNEMLMSIKQHIAQTYRLFVAKSVKLDNDDLKKAIIEAFNEKLGKTNISNDFHDVFDSFCIAKKNTVSTNMIKKYSALHNHLKEFETFSNYKLSFKSLDMIFFYKFQDYLINQKKHSSNTLAKDFDILRTFCNWSAECGYLATNKYKKFKTKTDETPIIALEKEELQNIIDLNLNDLPYLDRVRDVFVFACFTGLRFSDIKNLKRENIQNDTIILRTQKTKDTMNIPLLTIPLQILYKYRNDPQPLPVISAQKTNDYLKKVAELANITPPVQTVQYIGAERIETTTPRCELITFHTARKTFVTVSLLNGMRPDVIMKLTGHKNFKTMERYIKHTDKSKLQEIKKWEQPTLKVI